MYDDNRTTREIAIDTGTVLYTWCSACKAPHTVDPVPDAWKCAKCGNKNLLTPLPPNNQVERQP